MSTSGQPFQTHGFQTSIDIARRQTYNNVTSLAGRKRPPDTSADDIPKAPGALKRPTTQFQGLNGNNNNNNSNNIQSVDFVRASAPIPRNCLVASEIRPVGVDATAGNGNGNGQGSLQTDSTKTSSPSVSGPDQDPLLSLKDPRYGLPPTLVANCASLGVTSIYPWQASCLLGQGLLAGERHLVYTAPTGGGKSLVADVLMLKRVIENPSRKAILVLPYVALVQEKLRWLRRIVQDVEKNVPGDEGDSELDSNPSRQRWKRQQKSIRVTGYFGGSRTTATWADTDIAVCTIEKVCASCSYVSAVVFSSNNSSRQTR